MKHSSAASLAIAFVLAAAGNAFADDITMDPPFVSTASRAQVQEELRQFRTAGTNPWADGYDQLAGLRSSRSRAEVTAEFLPSRAAVAAFAGEDSGSSYLARMNAREEPRATELAQVD